MPLASLGEYRQSDVKSYKISCADTQADREFPHAEKKTIADHLRKFESLLTLTPQRMRMIVHAIAETLDKGLKKEGQVVPMSEFPCS